MAIFEPKISGRYYYFNEARNAMFGLTEETNNILPVFRNEITGKDSMDINRIKDKLIPKITYFK